MDNIDLTLTINIIIIEEISTNIIITGNIQIQILFSPKEITT